MHAKASGRGRVRPQPLLLALLPALKLSRGAASSSLLAAGLFSRRVDSSDIESQIEIWCRRYCPLSTPHIRYGNAAALFITGAYRKSLLAPRSGLADIKANAVSRQLI